MNLQKQTSLSKHAFLWRDRKGTFHDPKDMETSYLFNTLKMIWNNVVPEDQRVPPIKLYNFGSYYTNEYIADAVSAIVNELSTRPDISLGQLVTLQLMYERIPKCFTQLQISRVPPKQN